MCHIHIVTYIYMFQNTVRPSVCSIVNLDYMTVSAMLKKQATRVIIKKLSCTAEVLLLS